MCTVHLTPADTQCVCGVYTWFDVDSLSIRDLAVFDHMCILFDAVFKAIIKPQICGLYTADTSKASYSWIINTHGALHSGPMPSPNWFAV